jgi:hypothetical protein
LIIGSTGLLYLSEIHTDGCIDTPINIDIGHRILLQIKNILYHQGKSPIMASIRINTHDQTSSTPDKAAAILGRIQRNDKLADENHRLSGFRHLNLSSGCR